MVSWFGSPDCAAQSAGVSQPVSIVSGLENYASRCKTLARASQALAGRWQLSNGRLMRRSRHPADRLALGKQNERVAMLTPRSPRFLELPDTLLVDPTQSHQP